MTTYYKGNNIGLSYNASAGTWSFNNTPQDFIDTNAFSTPDPKFPTAPTTPTTPSDPTPDPCPAGYVYDKTLKQCVPDPNYQNPFRQDNNQGGGNEQPFQPGTGKELPKGVNYNPDSLFPYSTDAPTRAQQNEHMLLQSGISLGWLQDNGKGQYVKVPFNEKQGEGLGWAGMAIKYFNEKSYNDYFNILENGWQPEGKGLWDKFLRGNSVYSLKPNENGQFMKYAVSDRFNRLDEDFVYDFSPDFKKKITQAQSITGGMIDRDGNVNINADGKGGYYREDGKFVLNNGQVVSFGSMTAGLNYLANLEGSGLKLSNALRKRLGKALDSKNIDWATLNKSGKSIDYLRDLVKTYKQEKVKAVDKEFTEDKKDNDTSADDTSTINDGGTSSSPTGEQFYEQTYGPVDDEQGFGTSDSGSNNTDNTPPTGFGNPGDAGGSTSSGSSNNYPNTPPPGTPSSPPSSAGEAFKRYGRF